MSDTKGTSSKSAHKTDLFNYADSELVIGLVGAIGTDLYGIAELLTNQLKKFNYKARNISISKDVISVLYPSDIPKRGLREAARIRSLMDLGNRARKESQNNAILAFGAASDISRRRGNGSPPLRRTAHIVISLKNQEEVSALRQIYARGFFLIGIHSDVDRRRKYLKEEKELTDTECDNLIAADSNEEEGHGQKTSDTFHLADFFIHSDKNEDRVKSDIRRILNLLFGDPFTTPTFDEMAMYFAFSAALRSADLSRQVGAVVAKNDQVLSMGANDVPAYGGGLYWPQRDIHSDAIVDAGDGRDYMRGGDENSYKKQEIAADIADRLGGTEEEKSDIRKIVLGSRLKDLTEYGRVVHAEMDALLACGRLGVSTIGATLYCTTFPCHNCAKHIIAAGIKKVVFVEPYPKSKAMEFHRDSAVLGSPQGAASEGRVVFEPFVGVGPRSFYNLFSMNAGSGYPTERKNSDGTTKKWSPKVGVLRRQLLPLAYAEREKVAVMKLKDFIDSRGQHEKQ